MLVYILNEYITDKVKIDEPTYYASSEQIVLHDVSDFSHMLRSNTCEHLYISLSIQHKPYQCEQCIYTIHVTLKAHVISMHSSRDDV